MVVSVSSSVSVHLGGDDAGAAQHLETISSVRSEGDGRAEVVASVALGGGAPGIAGLASPTLESFAFSGGDDAAGTTTVLGGAPDAGGETYVHNPGDGDLTIPGFDFAADRLVLHGEDFVGVDFANDVAQVHLADGSTVVLEAMPRDPFG